MIDAKIRDHMGRERVIRSADDVNRLIGEIEAERDRLADTMLGSDREAAINAEKASDWIEDEYMPILEKEMTRIQALLNADAADDHRRAKARAIKERNRSS